MPALNDTPVPAVKSNRLPPSATPDMVLLVKLALPMLLSVLVAPDIDLLVSVSVVSLPTNVVVASGNVTTRPAEDTASNKVTALAALLELLKRMPLLKSVPSLMVTKPVPLGWMCTPVFALDPSAYKCNGTPTPIPFFITK